MALYKAIGSIRVVKMASPSHFDPAPSQVPEEEVQAVFTGDDVTIAKAAAVVLEKMDKFVDALEMSSEGVLSVV